MELLTSDFGSKPPPSPRFAHPELGELAWCDEGCWQGEIIHGGAKVRLVIAGDEACPNTRLARAALATVAKLARLREEAIALIQHESRAITPTEPTMFTLVGVCYPHVDRPEEFWLELGIEGDHDGTWRVEFGPVQELAAPEKSADAMFGPVVAGTR